MCYDEAALMSGDENLAELIVPIATRLVTACTHDRTLLGELLEPLFRGPFRDFRFFIQVSEARLDISDHSGVISKFNGVAQDAFFRIEVLLRSKNDKVEVILQHFVAVVDAQLFEAVIFEDLEAEDVQQTDVRHLFGGVHIFVYPLDDVGEGAVV